MYAIYIFQSIFDFAAILLLLVVNSRSLWWKFAVSSLKICLLVGVCEFV